MRTCTILYNRQNTFGLAQDAAVIQRALSMLGGFQKPRLADPREPLVHVDLQIHLEVPVYGAVAWAHTNVLLVNAEHYSVAWDAYLHAFDAVLFRCAADAAAFEARVGVACHVLPWAVADPKAFQKEAMTANATPMRDFVCFLGGSQNKFEALRAVEWPADAPILDVYTTRADFAEGLKGRGFSVHVGELSAEEHRRVAARHMGHLVVSRAESFGYAAAEAEAVGAYLVASDLPVFREQYGEAKGVAFTDGTCASIDRALGGYVKELSPQIQERAQARMAALVKKLRPLLGELEKLIVARKPKGVLHCPPILQVADCPPITVVTPTFGRKKLFEIAMHNMLMTDYPQDKIEWIVVEDCEIATGAQGAAGDGSAPVGHLVGDSAGGSQPLAQSMPVGHLVGDSAGGSQSLAQSMPVGHLVGDSAGGSQSLAQSMPVGHLVGDDLIAFQLKVPRMAIKYIPVFGRMSIGQKRNHAIAEASHEIIVFMDDDDHYPATSFRRRVAWLTKGGTRAQSIACCTTLALYDLKRGVSGVNVPPMELPLAQRISEATLAFRKSAWAERRFPDVSLAEGEGWVAGREDQVIEIPPQQIVVAFTHGANQSSRRLPPSDQPPSCFWGFPHEYLVFVHGLVGVEIEPAKRS
jgi:hypothetical protein